MHCRVHCTKLGMIWVRGVSNLKSQVLFFYSAFPHPRFPQPSLLQEIALPNSFQTTQLQVMTWTHLPPWKLFAILNHWVRCMMFFFDRDNMSVCVFLGMERVTSSSLKTSIPTLGIIWHLSGDLPIAIQIEDTESCPANILTRERFGDS